MSRAHLFVDISAHGFGHLAQVAPVLNVLFARLPELRVTLRSKLPYDRLCRRIAGPFVHLPESSDFGYVMRDATRVDLAATALAYQEQHADWSQRVAKEARFLAELAPDLVLSDIAYLPLAAAREAGIRSIAISSLNWAELFAYFYGEHDWASAIHRQMLDAYCCADLFLRLTPGMAMSDLPRVQDIGPIAALGNDCRAALRSSLGCTAGDRLVLIAFGGIDFHLPITAWPMREGMRWLVPAHWRPHHPRAVAIEALGYPFSDLLRSVDAVITKPGYGTFVESACNGTPLLYVRRDDWPEQQSLIAWLRDNAQCSEVVEAELSAGNVDEPLAALWRQPLAAPTPRPLGAAQAADLLVPWLVAARRSGDSVKPAT